MESLKRIAIIGPESTGKSLLCEALANHYKTVWVKEYARTYLPDLKHKYTIEDILLIFKTQFNHEQELISSANKFIFVDTEFIIGKVWCEYVFNVCPDYFNEMISKYPYDLYLLCSPDLPWKYDLLRENPGKGDFFFDWYKQILNDRKFSYGVVTGINSERTENAVKLVDDFF